MSFKANDKEVCVDDSPGRFTNRWRGKALPIRKGLVYCVTDFWMCPRRRLPTVSLAGVDMGVNANGRRIGLLAFRFRLVSEVGHPAVAITEAATAEPKGFYGSTQVAAGAADLLAVERGNRTAEDVG